MEVIVGAVLTQNTAWTNVERAVANLKRRRLMSLTALCRVPRTRLARCIRPAGFYNLKADRLKSVANWIAACGGLAGLRRIPTARLRPALLTCPGVGPETADSILLYALDRPVFVVDAYTRRILGRLGLIREDETYDEIQAWFHEHLPQEVQTYNEFHALLVRLAKSHCRATPVCCGCPLSGICPPAITQAGPPAV